jgi:hypothetical protein
MSHEQSKAAATQEAMVEQPTDCPGILGLVIVVGDPLLALDNRIEDCIARRMKVSIADSPDSLCKHYYQLIDGTVFAIVTASYPRYSQDTIIAGPILASMPELEVDADGFAIGNLP